MSCLKGSSLMNVSSPLHACGLLRLSCVLSEKFLSAWSTSVRWRWVFWYTIWHFHFLIGFPRKNSDIEMVKWRAVGQAAAFLLLTYYPARVCESYNLQGIQYNTSETMHPRERLTCSICVWKRTAFSEQFWNFLHITQFFDM